MSDLSIEDLKDKETGGVDVDLDLDAPESGQPDLDDAGWDNEIEEEDRDDLEGAGIDFNELGLDDREAYLEFTALRKEVRDGTAGDNVLERVKDIVSKCDLLIAGAETNSKREFHNIICQKLEDLK